MFNAAVCLNNVKKIIFIRGMQVTSYLVNLHLQTKQTDMAKLGMRKPLAVAVIHISQIHSLKPGPNAGKKIG